MEVEEHTTARAVRSQAEPGNEKKHLQNQGNSLLASNFDLSKLDSHHD